MGRREYLRCSTKRPQDSKLGSSVLFRFLTAYMIIHEAIQLAAWKHPKNILIVLKSFVCLFHEQSHGKILNTLHF